VCRRTQNHSVVPLPPEPPPIFKSRRKVTASTRVIFIGSTAAAAARTLSGNNEAAQGAVKAAVEAWRNRRREIRCFGLIPPVYHSQARQLARRARARST